MAGMDLGMAPLSTGRAGVADETIKYWSRHLSPMEKRGDDPPWLAKHGSETEKEMLQLSHISLLLSDYTDIFSDFDPRPYSQRALSDDFLSEARKASRDMASGRIELKLLMPAAKRDPHQEAAIRKRLHEHFRKHHDLHRAEMKGMIRRGLLSTAMGIMLMFIATLILFKDGHSITNSFFIILLEPAGWFFFWTGLDQVIFESKKKMPDLGFYEKMTRCEIDFLSY